MDADTAVGAVAGIVGGGTLVTWLARSMLARLIKQLDDVTKDHVALDKVVSTSGAHLMANVEKTDRLSGEQVRTTAELAAVRQRVEGLSKDYGPKLENHAERLTRLESRRAPRERDDD